MQQPASRFSGRCLALFLLLACFTFAPLGAQQYLATLTGEVTDASGAKVAKAEVTATAARTQFTTKIVTNNSGGYSIPFLTPDTYTVTITAAGSGQRAARMSC